MLTRPMVIGGRRPDVGRIRNNRTAGTAISSPKPAAVATARWIGTPCNVISGTPKLPPPMPIRTEAKPTAGEYRYRFAPVGMVSASRQCGRENAM